VKNNISKNNKDIRQCAMCTTNNMVLLPFKHYVTLVTMLVLEKRLGTVSLSV